MHSLLLSLFLLSMFQSCKMRPADTGTEKFAAEYSDDFWGESKRLIQVVHERKWTIAYTISPKCNTGKLPKDKVFEDAISRAVQLWLHPVRKVAESVNKNVEIDIKYFKLPIKTTRNVNNYVKYLLKEQRLLRENKANLHINFSCLRKRSHVSSDAYERPSMYIYSTTLNDKHWARRSETIGNSSFSFGVLLHEMGHAFGLLDTYPPRDGGQPASIMSCSLVGNVLGEDDIKGIQWLYRYTHAKETIPQENPCFFADYEQQKGQKFGKCLPKHPLITLLNQAKAHEQLGKTEVAIRILEKAEQVIGKRLSFDINKINAQDKDGNTALHLVVKYFLTSEKINTSQPSWWPTNSHPPVYWAAVGASLLSLKQCSNISSTGEQRIQELKLIYDRCVSQKNKNCVCIDPQIKNNAGKTARDLALDANANDIVQVIDDAMRRSLSANRR